MNNERTGAYEAPQVEVIEVEVEKGFAASTASITGTTVNEGMGNAGGGSYPNW